MTKYEKDQKDAKDKDRIIKGEHEKLLAEQKAEQETKDAALKSFEKSTKERADRLLAKLDDAKKERVERYKDKLPLADWVTMIEEEIEMGASGGDDSVGEKKPPVPGGTPSAGSRQNNGMRELQPKSLEILEQLGVNPESGQRLLVRKDTAGNAHFLPMIRAQIEGMRKAAKGGRPWTAEEAAKGRKGG